MTEKIFKIVNGDISDGYHTFDDLYDHRCMLFIAFCCQQENIGHPPGQTYWIKNHYEGWDLLVTHLNGKQVSYHVPAARYRDLYKDWIPEVTPLQYSFDGHTATDVLNRFDSWIKEEFKSPLEES